MLDLIPPTTFLVLNGFIAFALAIRRDPWGDGLIHRSLALVWASAPALYGMGALLFLLGGQWRPGLALGGLGTLAVPSALVLYLLPRRSLKIVAIALAAGTWLLVWIPALRPESWGLLQLERCLRIYLSLTLALGGWALFERWKMGSLTEVHKRVFFTGLPFFLIALAYLQFKAVPTQKAVYSGSIHVSAEILLLSLVGPKARRQPRFPFLTVVLQGLLLAAGAFLITLFAANVGIFPKEAGPIIVSTTVATLLAVATGLGRRPLDLLIKNALYPEAVRANRRLGELEQELQATRDRLRLAEHSSVVAQLAAQVAHEIKNPLGPIKGYTKVIERELEKTGAVNEVISRGIDIIRQEVEAIDSRARTLLELALPPQLRVESIDFVALGQDVIDLVQSDAPPTVRLGWRACPKSAPGRGDPVILRGAILNVVQNSVQALTAAGGSVELSLEAAGSRWQLVVDDDGPGLPEGDPERLFQPFVSHREDGTGLGLVIARGALRSSGGELELSRREAGGTRARLLLPGAERVEEQDL